MSGTAEALSASLKSQIKELIVGALRLRYISTSSHMGYTTGNAYQALKLGDEQVGGYRQDRSELFKSFDLTGQRVLDCGCNLGELSRLARDRGAALVDGIEFDPYFVQIARLINAYHGTSRVSFSQGDLTNPETIKESYDVSFAFSVFPYVLPILKKLSESTREALILETHDVTPNLRKVYIDPVSRYFPHHTFVNYSDFGHGEGRRAVIVFAKKKETLISGRIMRSTVDIAHSDLRHIDAMRDLMRGAAPDGQRNKGDIEKLVRQGTEILNDEQRLTAGRTYWIEMMKGFVQYERETKMTPENSYVVFLRRIMAQYNFDPIFSEKMSSDIALTAQVECRFADINKLAAGDPAMGNVDPLTIIVSDEADAKFSVRHGQTGATIFARLMDGYHRTFWAVFFGVRKMQALYTF